MRFETPNDNEDHFGAEHLRPLHKSERHARIEREREILGKPEKDPVDVKALVNEIIIENAGPHEVTAKKLERLLEQGESLKNFYDGDVQKVRNALVELWQEIREQ